MKESRRTLEIVSYKQGPNNPHPRNSQSLMSQFQPSKPSNPTATTPGKKAVRIFSPIPYSLIQQHQLHVLALVFAVEQINKDLRLLPNISLGFHLYDNLFRERLAVEQSLLLLSGAGRTVPNYSCEGRRKLVAVIGGIRSTLSVAMANVIGFHKFPQITYGPFDAHLRDVVHLPSLYQMAPRDTAPDLTQEMRRHGICVALKEQIPETDYYGSDQAKELFKKMNDLSVNVAVVYGDIDSIIMFKDYSRGYYKDGDLVIGALLALNVFEGNRPEFNKYPFWFDDRFARIYQHQLHVLALVFAVEQINKDPSLLPNISLGFHLYDNLFRERLAVEQSLMLLSGAGRTVPNYSCERRRKLVAVIGGIRSTLSVAMANVIGFHKFPQITYGPFDASLRDSLQFPSLYQMAPKDTAQQQGIVQLLLYFDWTWVSLIVSNNVQGETFVRDLTQEMRRHGVCVALTEQIPETDYYGTRQVQILDQKMNDLSVNVAIVYGDIDSLITFKWVVTWVGVKGKVWINPAHFDDTVSNNYLLSDNYFRGSLSFSIHTDDMPSFKDFLLAVNPSKYPSNVFLKDFWKVAVGCSFEFSEQWGHRVEPDCTGNESFVSLNLQNTDMELTGLRYTLYCAVYRVALALHEMLLSRSEMEMSGTEDIMVSPPWQLHSFLRRSQFNVSTGDQQYIDGSAQSVPSYDILNLQELLWNQWRRVKIGEFKPQASKGNDLIIDKEAIVWGIGFHQTPPRSMCSNNCLPGFRKTARERKAVCCYDCTLCPEGEISNQTAFTLGLFIKHRDTPIVKANNRGLSYILLISLMLSFLCSLIFIGRPSPASCILRQTAFGIIFSVAVASVLAKTITVVLAFRVTKPRSRFRGWMGPQISNSVILICCLIQVTICGVWLGTSPPFPDFNRQAEFGHIVLECNEGSITAFYCVLGYMGFLALVSFMVAFLARNLPDTFNEARFITFSMLVFCSVWITFLPTYLSTKGKAMVAVEIFSILASSAGLLGCIFGPKVYVILLRPDRNSREKLMRKPNISIKFP
ncbi:vomeronasal type-2 receptor 26-like [Ornithorhynchus anatinus]|uniref:vomeronasal type-2 receptor 26-like n=1 Tax=Ornithorhynchus anatinus TaxID=9258 RepID=UPI0019D451CF|nr:vomeronasal type-2 receptor 26-like [Ornithorhynchus anatinus]